MTKQKIKFFTLFVFLLILILGCTRQSIVEINGKNIPVIIAQSPQDKEKGLSSFVSLDFDKGMLFVYDNYAPRTFWMKGMKFPIDIIWIVDNKVVGVEQNISPEQGPDFSLYSSQGPVNLVLEVNAGFSKANNIQVGDIVTIYE